MKNTGERIKALLNEKKMTQIQLAELSGVTESALSHYIKGDCIPSGVVSANIAYAFQKGLKGGNNNGKKTGKSL